MNNPDHNSESLETIFWVKILNFFYEDPDLGSGNLFDPESGIWDGKNSDPGSATLILTCYSKSNGKIRCKKMTGRFDFNRLVPLWGHLRIR
jgi:hypothetical protein